MFGLKRKKKQPERKEYDAAMYKPALKCSICNGEQVAGFLNRQTGKFEEIALITGPEELQDFLDTYGLKEVEKIY